MDAHTQDKPAAAATDLKTLTLDVTEISVHTFADGGKQYTFTGKEVDGKEDRPRKAILSGEIGRKLEAALASTGTPAPSADTPARITFEGRWNKRNWTHGSGEKRFTWEFKTFGFTHGDVVERAEPRPLKTLDLVITDADQRIGVDGYQRLLLKGVDGDGKRRNAIAWGEQAEELAGTIREALKGQGGEWIDDTNHVRVELRGNWKKSSHTSKKGKTFENWEFVVAQHGSAARHAPVEKKAKKEASEAELVR